MKTLPADIYFCAPGTVGRGIGSIKVQPRTLLVVPRDELPYTLPDKVTAQWFAVIAPGAPREGEPLRAYLARVDAEGGTVVAPTSFRSIDEARRNERVIREFFRSFERQQAKRASICKVGKMKPEQVEVAKRIFPGTTAEYVADYALRHDGATPDVPLTAELVKAIRKRKRAKTELTKDELAVIELATRPEEYFELTHDEKAERINRKLGTSFTGKAIKDKAQSLGISTKHKGRPPKPF